jgi:hypothetical protein
MVVRNENTRVSAATPGEIGQWGALIKVRELLIVADSNKARRARDILLEQEQLDPDNSMVQAYLSQCTNHFVVTGMTHWREGRAEMMR